MGAFRDGQSALNFAAARLRHIAGRAWSTKRYLNIKLLVRPLQDGVRRQLGAIVAHDRLWLAALIEKPIELTSNPNAGDRRVRDERQALSRAIVDHNEDTQATSIDELIGSMCEAVGPAWSYLRQSLTADPPSHFRKLP